MLWYLDSLLPLLKIEQTPASSVFWAKDKGHWVYSQIHWQTLTRPRLDSILSGLTLMETESIEIYTRLLILTSLRQKLSGLSSRIRIIARCASRRTEMCCRRTTASQRPGWILFSASIKLHNFGIIDCITIQENF